MTESGDRVPDLPLQLASGGNATLGDYAGKWLVMYFYPKDATPGCTTEGLDFNALLPKFRRAGAVVLGVSKDSLKSHRSFCEKQGFKFDLVSDGEGALCDAFGVIQPRKLYGREFLGIVRSTFLIDPAGAVRRKWQPVKVSGHAQAVLEALKAEQSE
ncbi:peroxiredoxin [Thermomonas sp.]|uniref:peroxiredoxin n=1 Tax=Thermomonas sp. TaxID=1971895 RepID=UPI00261AE771|nr:peroxiredoxin [Thermomonas sp.]